MDESERKRAAVRYDCMEWAMQTAAPGADAEGIVARAQLFADFVLAEGVLPIHFHQISHLKNLAPDNP